MGYMHIENLYRRGAQMILAFKQVYALEKIHGTSAHVLWSGHDVRFFSGGENYERFCALFDHDHLRAKFVEMFGEGSVIVYGEAYGGKCQGMRKTYGDLLRFVAFDVKVADKWLDVPKAHAVVESLGLAFVHYDLVSSDLASLDAERDRPSTQAKRNGIATDCISEGIVIRPPFEVTLNSGNRLIAKHKRAEFSERKTIPNVDPTKLEILERADAIAEEWVTEMRLTHVLDHLGNPSDMSAIPTVIKAMIEDVCREASGEIIESKDARRAIGARAVQLFKARLMTVTQ